MIPLTVLPNDNGRRQHRDRLELLTTLIAAPSFDPVFRDDHIVIPPDHRTFGWGCQVPDCERRKTLGEVLCRSHRNEWADAKTAGMSRADFLAAATPLKRIAGSNEGTCLVCPGRGTVADSNLCHAHHSAWKRQVAQGDVDHERWLSEQEAMPGFG